MWWYLVGTSGLIGEDVWGMLVAVRPWVVQTSWLLLLCLICALWVFLKFPTSQFPHMPNQKRLVLITNRSKGIQLWPLLCITVRCYSCHCPLWPISSDGGSGHSQLLLAWFRGVRAISASGISMLFLFLLWNRKWNILKLAGLDNLYPTGLKALLRSWAV